MGITGHVKRAPCSEGNLLKGYTEEETWSDLHLEFPLVPLWIMMAVGRVWKSGD